MQAVPEHPVTLFARTEEGVVAAVQWLKLSVELVGATIIFLGILTAGALLLKALVARRTADFTAIRLTLARYLALALEFQLGADILSTAIAPSWEQMVSWGHCRNSDGAQLLFVEKKWNRKKKSAAPRKS